MAETNVTSNQVNQQNVDTIKYHQDDINLLGGNIILRDFGLPNDYIEQILYDTAGNLINTNYNYTQQQIQSTPVSEVDTTTEIYINPTQDLQQLGYTSAECLEAAWNEIKDRKGKTEGGVFIREK